VDDFSLHQQPLAPIPPLRWIICGYSRTATIQSLSRPPAVQRILFGSAVSQIWLLRSCGDGTTMDRHLGHEEPKILWSQCEIFLTRFGQRTILRTQIRQIVNGSSFPAPTAFTSYRTEFRNIKVMRASLNRAEWREEAKLFRFCFGSGV